MSTPDPNVPANPAPNPPAALTREEVQDMLKGKFGSDVSPDMLNRLTDLTQRAAAAEAKVTTLETQLASAGNPAGSVLLAGDEAAAYTALKAREGYGAAPLKTATEKIDQSAEALGKVARLEIEARQDVAFRALGYDPAKVRKYLPDLDARMEGEGDAAKPVIVTKAADGTVTTRDAAEAMAADHAEIISVLSTDGTGPANRGGFAPGVTIAQRSANPGQPPAQATDEEIAAAQRRRLDFSL